MLKRPFRGAFPWGAALLAASWLASDHYQPWVSWHAEVLAFGAVILQAWLVLFAVGRREPNGQLHLPLAVIPFLAFALVASAQFIAGRITFFGDLFNVWLYAGLCVLSLQLGFSAQPKVASRGVPGADSPYATVLAWTLVLGAFLSVCVALAQVFDLWMDSAWIARMPTVRRPGANIGQTNQLATLLVMALASTAYLYASGRLSGLPAIALMLFLGLGLATTESRTGILSVLILAAWWQYKRRDVALRASRWMAPGLAVLAVLMYLGWSQLLAAADMLPPNEGGSAYSVAADAPNVHEQNRALSIRIRLSHWTQMLDASLQHPWAGWGVFGVPKAHNAVADAYPVNSAISYSHNVLVDWVVWLGFPMAIGLLVLVAVWLWRRVRACASLLPWYCLAACLPLFVHSLLEFPFAYAYFLVPVLVLIGMLEASLGGKGALRLGVRSATIGLLAMTAALLWSAIEYVRIEEDFRYVRFEYRRIGQTPAEYRPPSVILFTQVGALLTATRTAVRPGMSSDDLGQLRDLALRYPWYTPQYRYALALALNGRQDEALRQFKVLRTLYGEAFYTATKDRLRELEQTQFPELRNIQLP